MGRISKEGLSLIGSGVMSGTTGSGQGGCLACSKCHVASLFGAIPLERSIRLALPIKPEWSRETVELMVFL